MFAGAFTKDLLEPLQSVPSARNIKAAIRQGASGRAVPCAWARNAVDRVQSGCDLGDVLEEFFTTQPLNVDWAAYMPKDQLPSVARAAFFAAARADGHPMAEIVRQYARQPEVVARVSQRTENRERTLMRSVERHRGCWQSGLPPWLA